MTKYRLKPRIWAVATSIVLLFCQHKTFAQTSWFKVGSAPDKYETGIDSNMRHEGQSSITLKSIEETSEFGALMQNSKPDTFIGKRVKMSAYIKSKDLTNWAGIWLRIDRANSQEFLSFDNMNDRPIQGSTDWKKYEIVLDVPSEASNLAFGLLMNGGGQIWFDKLKFEIVDNSIPTTGMSNQK